jgi:hypothetical protein
MGADRVRRLHPRIDNPLVTVEPVVGGIAEIDGNVQQRRVPGSVSKPDIAIAAGGEAIEGEFVFDIAARVRDLDPAEVGDGVAATEVAPKQLRPTLGKDLTTGWQPSEFYLGV